jgi:broad specificity phosphatase PhoE
MTSAELALSKSKYWAPEKSFKKVELLREINFGCREGLPRTTTLEEAISIKAQAQNIPIEEYIDTSEKAGDVKSRQVEFLKMIYRDHIKESNGGETVFNILCVSHGAYIKRFLRNFVDIQVEKIKNCALSVIDIEYESMNKYVCTAVPNLINVKASDEVYDNEAHQVPVEIPE